MLRVIALARALFPYEFKCTSSVQIIPGRTTSLLISLVSNMASFTQISVRLNFFSIDVEVEPSTKPTSQGVPVGPWDNLQVQQPAVQNMLFDGIDDFVDLGTKSVEGRIVIF